MSVMCMAIQYFGRMNAVVFWRSSRGGLVAGLSCKGLLAPCLSSASLCRVTQIVK